jgi:DNA-directed RNA polymerase specialized sigma24 family protein
MKPKTDRNKEIVRLRDEEGRTYDWIAEQEGISNTMVRRIYHREKYTERQAKLKQQEAQA